MVSVERTGAVSIEIACICAGALLLSAWLTGRVRKSALARGVLDIPNERSSHQSVMPRGGGLAIVLAFNAGLVALAAFGCQCGAVLLALAGGGLAVAAIGFVDDRWSVPPAWRLSVHLAAAIWAVVCLGGLPALTIGNLIVSLSWIGYVLAVLSIVWTLNLFNFMDGIDGIAASEAVFICAGAGTLSLLHAGDAGSVGTLAWIFCAACLGFLLWNWPPARIFMGDVGSGYLGFVIAVLAIAADHDDPAAPWTWLILGGVFFVDASVTLVRRALRGERVYEAHRTHAYQWLARRWGHRRVTVSVWMVNVLWLWPSAALATSYPGSAIWVLITAFVPLICLSVAVGSGRAEVRSV